MKPTQVTELLANIRKTFVSFFSILMFVALGVGIFLGIMWAGPALQTAADNVYDEGAFHDFQVQFPYGLTDDDLAKLSQLEGVTDVEPARQSFQVLVVGGSAKAVKVQTLGQRIDVPAVVEGELPTAAGEIALDAVSARDLGIRVGDAVAFQVDAQAGPDADDDGMTYLNGASYRVTALVESPEYLSRSKATYGSSPSGSGSVDMLAWVPAGAFDAKAFRDGYPVVNVRCDVLRGMGTFTDEYKHAVADAETRVHELGDTLADERFTSLHDQAQQTVSESEAKLADAKEQISSGEEQLEQARMQLERGRISLEEAVSQGQAQLASAYEQLLAGEDLKAVAEAQLAEGKAMLAESQEALGLLDGLVREGNAKLANAQTYEAKLDAQLSTGEITQEEHDKALDAYGADLTAELRLPAEQAGVQLPDITHENFNAALAEAEARIADVEDVTITVYGQTMTVAEAREKAKELAEQVQSGEAQLAEKVAQLNAGWAQYYEGQAQLQQRQAEGEQRLLDGQQQVMENERKLEDARKQVAENEPKLERAKEQLAAMKNYDWTVFSRQSNAGVVMVSMFSGVTDNLSYSMAALFVIVGLLVSYSAVSRIVHEQITQIGTKKALGLREREITTSFLAYSALAVVAGAIIGTIVGVTLVEGIIGHVLGGMFALGDYPPHFGLALFLAVTALELVLVLGATWLACHSILREQAVELLKGEKPPEAKTRFYEKWALWDRLPLFTQTIVNNCVNDKRRVFSTVVGVAGCTALIVCAVTLNDDVLKSYDRQYQDVYGFNAIVYVDTEVEDAAADVEVALQREGAMTAQVRRSSIAMIDEQGGSVLLHVVVPADAEAFARVYHVNPVMGAAFDPDAQGVWMTQAYAEHHGAKVGDIVRVSGSDGSTHEMPVLGFYEYWLTSLEMLMGPAYYEAEFGSAPAPNAVLADTGDAAVADVQQRLSTVNGFASISDDKAAQNGTFKEFASVSRAVVLIYLALSALMAVVVLLNLNVMFIQEKKRDLIVLMINGFSVRDAKRYIYNDTIVLTVIGVVCGVVLGCVMGSVTVGAVEPTSATFVKDVDWTAVAVGAVGSAVLAAIMTIIALRRIPRFELTDINKF